MKILSGKRSKGSGVGVIILPAEKKKNNATTIGEQQFLQKLLGFSLEAELKKRKVKRDVLSTFTFSIPGNSSFTSLVVGFTERSLDKQRELLERLAADTEKELSHTSEAAVFVFSSVFEDGLDLDAFTFVESLSLARYSFTEYKSDAAKKKPSSLTITFDAEKKLSIPTVKRALQLVSGVTLARDLVNTPAADCPPRHLASTAKKIASQSLVTTKVFSTAQLKAKGMNGIFSVGMASKEQPLFVTLDYKPKKKVGRDVPVVGLVGKGVTFDSGGLSIKSGAGMETMKCDMGGAAAVLGTFQALSLLQPAIRVKGYVPTAENMIQGNALKPGDVIKMSSGKTVEVLNTDAEGRLILADALHYASHDGCDIIIDLATLTGSSVVALGEKFAGLFSRDDELVDELLFAAEEAGERYWHMPLVDEYKEQLKSNVADIKNIGTRWGGSITAALFLEHFVSAPAWAHMDIAGPAFTGKREGIVPRGGSGFGVRTLVKFLEGLAE